MPTEAHSNMVKGAQALAAVLRAGKASHPPQSRKKPVSKTIKGWQIKTRPLNGIKFMEFDGKGGKRVRLSLGTRCDKEAEGKASKLFLAYWDSELGTPKQP